MGKTHPIARKKEDAETVSRHHDESQVLQISDNSIGFGQTREMFRGGIECGDLTAMHLIQIHEASRNFHRIVDETFKEFLLVLRIPKFFRILQKETKMPGRDESILVTQPQDFLHDSGMIEETGRSKSG